MHIIQWFGSIQFGYQIAALAASIGIVRMCGIMLWKFHLFIGRWEGIPGTIKSIASQLAGNNQKFIKNDEEHLVFRTDIDNVVGRVDRLEEDRQ